MIMEIKLTQNKEFFDTYNVPKCDLTLIRDENIKFPTELRFGKKYYKLDNGKKLVAFKVLAYAVYSRHTTSKIMGLSFLVQLPNSEPQWIENFIRHYDVIFESKDAFFEHQVNGNCNINLEWKNGTTAFSSLARDSFIGFWGKGWQWDNNTRSSKNNFYPRFEHLLVTKEGMAVYIPNNTYGSDDTFLSKTDCVKNKLNGLVIEDFEEDNEKEDLVINIQIITTKPKIHTLHFLEE